MKALTIAQPYAEMIRLGEKRVENRTWPTRYRGLMYVHAGKSREWWDEEVDRKRYPRVAWGAVVAIANLADCVRLDDPKAHRRHPWLGAHEHTHGPWCWILESVSPIGPWPYKGQQGLFEIDDLDLIANRTLGIPDPTVSKG